MSLVRSMVLDNGVARSSVPGDLVSNSEAPLTLTNAAAQQLTAAQIASGILLRAGPGAGYGDTFPTASDLIAALNSNFFIAAGAYSPNGLQQNMSWRLRIINTVGFANTLVAGTGVTLSGVTAIPASSWKDYLITILNGSPPATYAGNTTSGSAAITGLSPAGLQYATVGAIVTGTGIPAGTTVLGVTQSSVILSANATATGSAINLTFSPAYSVTGLGGGSN